MSAVPNRRSESSLRIVALTAGELSGEWEFEKDVVTLGRGAGTDIRFEGNKKISRLHCVFEVRADGIWVKDANSINGTWLNNRRITEARVNPEDLVSVAGIRFRALSQSGAQEKTPAEPSQTPFFSAPAQTLPEREISNVVPFRVATPAEAPVDTDRTKPEIKALEPELSLPEPEAPVETIVSREPELAPVAPAFYVGGKRRPARTTTAEPSKGLTGGQKLVIALAIGGTLMFGGLVVVAAIAAAVLMN